MDSFWLAQSCSLMPSLLGQTLKAQISFSEPFHIYEVEIEPQRPRPRPTSTSLKKLEYWTAGRRQSICFRETLTVSCNWAHPLPPPTQWAGLGAGVAGALPRFCPSFSVPFTFETGDHNVPNISAFHLQSEKSQEDLIPPWFFPPLLIILKSVQGSVW